MATTLLRSTECPGPIGGNGCPDHRTILGARRCVGCTCAQSAVRRRERIARVAAREKELLDQARWVEADKPSFIDLARQVDLLQRYVF